MSIEEHRTRPGLPPEQRAYTCSADGKPLLDIYEFDVTHAVSLIWSGCLDLQLFHGAAALVHRDVHGALEPHEPLPALALTYVTDERSERFIWQTKHPRHQAHRQFLRDQGHAVSYVHCDVEAAYPFSMWAQLQAPRPGLVGFCALTAPTSLYDVIERTSITDVRPYDDDLRTLVQQHMEGMRARAGTNQ